MCWTMRSMATRFSAPRGTITSAYFFVGMQNSSNAGFTEGGKNANFKMSSLQKSSLLFFRQFWQWRWYRFQRGKLKPYRLVFLFFKNPGHSHFSIFIETSPEKPVYVFHFSLGIRSRVFRKLVFFVFTYLRLCTG